MRLPRTSRRWWISATDAAFATRWLRAPTDDEVLTLGAYWPLTGPKKFTQRVMIRATPMVANHSPEQDEQSAWTVR